MRLLALIIALCIVQTTYAKQVNPNKALVTIHSDVLSDYHAFLNGRDPLTIQDFSGPHSRRDVAEVILLQQAIVAGGLSVDFTFAAGNYYAKSIQLLPTGDILMSVDSIWSIDANAIAETVYISEPVIEKGDYEAGIYTSPNNRRAQSITTLEQLRKFSIVSSKKWRVDWHTLAKMRFETLIHEPAWTAQVSAVYYENVDLVLAPFQPTDDLSFQSKQLKLVPIVGIKVKLQDSRHFVVSKKHPMATSVFSALEKGIKKLKQTGTFKQAYRQAGFYNAKTKHWRVINQ